jgi:hypothetical protein
LVVDLTSNTFTNIAEYNPLTMTVAPFNCGYGTYLISTATGLDATKCYYMHRIPFGKASYVVDGATLITPVQGTLINAGISGWYGPSGELLDTSVEFDFDRLNITDITKVVFILQDRTTNAILATAVSEGTNLANLFGDCAQYWGSTLGNYSGITGIRTLSNAFKNRAVEEDNTYWVRSASAITPATHPAASMRVAVRIVHDRVAVISH